MKNIIVATDFSDVSLNAAKYAADMARQINAKLLLLHINEIVIPYGEVALMIGPDNKKAELEMDHFRNKLSTLESEELLIEKEVRMGIFIDELKNVCESVMPYAVVMGSVGLSAGERLLFGSHAILAMNHLSWPLITVPPDVTFSNINKIALACDFKDVVDTVPVDEIKTIVHDFKAELHVINTGKKNFFDEELIFQSGLFQEMMIDPKPLYHFIKSPDVDEGILELAEKLKIDLLIVLPKRHGLMGKLIHRSQSKQFVLHSHVPVMAIHQ